MARLKFWSLWEMLRLNAPDLASAAFNLGMIAERFVVQAEEAERGGHNVALIAGDQVDTIIASVSAINTIALGSGLSVTTAACNRLTPIVGHFKRHKSGGYTLPVIEMKRLGYMASALSITFTDELRTLSVVSVGSGASSLLEDSKPHFGQEVEDAFPSVAFDVAEASKCRALARWTASVMHLMRVLEVGLARLANFVGVDPNENWNTLLNQIESELRKVGKKTHGAADEQFAAEAATHFRAIKNAWRNHAMHAREKYDEERAVAIYDSVRSFMRHLATKLSE